MRALVVAAVLTGCAAQTPPGTSEFFPVPRQPALPFSEAVRVGNMLYLSGWLTSALSLAATASQWPFFRSHRPARSAFGTTGLALGARLELECIATGES